ncbi:cytochrome [Sesamum angolense]|uniref:Cytochrome n=1 Tax=Sesamum angolense TaxID=2727404 RepID=A0AAE2C6Z2_9LAMI|nr:cytochrome [Sesamum angolense]
MFSVARLDASQGVRREKLHKLWEYVKECSETGRAVDIGEAAFTTSLNLMSATLFSMDFAQFNSDTSQEMKDVVWGVMECIGSPNFADFFPVLKSADPQGILKKTKIYFAKLFAIFDGIIDEKLKSGGGKDDLVEALIELSQRDDAELSRNDVKHLLLVRDPYKWVESDAFMPERFLKHNMIDYRGKDFELIPFGAGRRICPGLPLAHRMVHLMLATLIHNFGWELEIKSKEIDMNEKFGLTLQKAISLRAIPTKL